MAVAHDMEAHRKSADSAAHEGAIKLFQKRAQDRLKRYHPVSSLWGRGGAYPTKSSCMADVALVLEEGLRRGAFIFHEGELHFHKNLWPELVTQRLGWGGR